jgi:pilus assembly protein CpaF
MTATGAYEQIRRAVLDEVERDRLDPEGDAGAIDQRARAAVDAYQRRAHLGEVTPLRDPDEMAARVLRSVTAYGPLTDLLASPAVEEVFIEGGRVTYLDAGGRLAGLDEPTTVEENRQVIDRLLSSSDRHLDVANPMVQARVLDGAARLTAAIPPVADQLSATLRRHAQRRETLASLADRGALTAAATGVLRAAMAGSASVLVSGPPGAGKTSLLAALLAAVPPTRCVRVCEEIRELNVALPHGGFYEARPRGLDGEAEITLRDLVKFTLAMRPDVLVVGEVRGAEAFELTRAINAGCGFACTVHANSAREALEALVNAAIMAGEHVGEPVVRKLFCSSVDLLVHCDIDDAGEGGAVRRGVTEIHAVAPTMADDAATTEPLLVRSSLDEPLRWTGHLPPPQRWTRAADGDLRELLSQGGPR